MNSKRNTGFGTKAIHAGQSPDPSTGAIMTPVYMTSTYVQEQPAVTKGYDYSRSGNPTRTALEGNLAGLEGGKHGLGFASGMAAITCVMNLLKSGDHVIAGNDLYGGTYRLLKTVYAKFGVESTLIDMTDLAHLRVLRFARGRVRHQVLAGLGRRGIRIHGQRIRCRAPAVTARHHASPHATSRQARDQGNHQRRLPAAADGDIAHHDHRPRDAPGLEHPVFIGFSA